MPHTSSHIFIDLEKITPELRQWVDTQSKAGEWSENATKHTYSLLDKGLHGRCITRDLVWGTPVPKEGYENKVFYVWFDAPIGYISITANYLGAENDDWKKWWQNPENVELFQFMGKDNTTFHTVIFPSTLIGSKQPWTMMKTISTTEWLNYEYEDEARTKPKKFSKSRGVGVFGDDAINSGVPCEVWRYYLLAVRPEAQDSVFLWDDFAAKNNNELLKNLGNGSNRCLKFLTARFDSTVPEYKGDLHAKDQQFLNTLHTLLVEYLELMEEIKIKKSLQVAMNVSSAYNGYLQEQEPWELIKKDKARCEQVMNIAVQALQLLCTMMEPFMPSFSAKIYSQMNLKRTAKQDVLLSLVGKSADQLRDLVPAGHKTGVAAPVFRQITDEEVLKWRAQFAGGQK